MASSASAAIKVEHGHTFSYLPLRSQIHNHDSVFGNVDYNGGPVMPSNTNYLIFWSPSGSAAYPAGYISGLQTYLKDLAHDSGLHTNVDSTSTQFNDSAGNFAAYKSTYGGSFVDTDPYPANHCPIGGGATHCLVDTDLQAELQSFLTAHHLPHDLKHEYFLMFPPHVENCIDTNTADGCSAGQPSNPAYCAYHGNRSSSPIFVYSNDPFVTGNFGCDDGNHPNNSPSDGALEGGFSHEHNESITDPIPNSAWTDTVNPSETGDKCAFTFGTPQGTHNGASYNQVINGHFYWYQEEWSNQNSVCLQKFTLSGSEPVPHFTATAGTGNTLNFDASASTGTIADFSWQFNDGPGLNTPAEQTTPTISHTFPAAGMYTVGLTTYTSNGTSRGIGGIAQPGHTGLLLGWSKSPASVVHGSPVQFSGGLTKIAGDPVVAYYWDFGDGTTGSIKTLSHTYAAAGKYKVSLVFMSNGGTAITSTTVTVS